MNGFIVTGLAFVLFGGSSVSALCDSSSNSKIQQCLFKSELFNPSTTPKDEASIQTFCRDNMDSIVKCMEEHTQECVNNEKEMKLMNLLVSIPDIRKGLMYMCNNISVLADKATCFSAFGESGFLDCLQNAVTTIANAGQATDIKSGLDMVCKFFDSFTGCFTDPFKGDCEPVGVIYGHVFQGVKYPYCKLNAVERQAAITDYEISAIGRTSIVQYSIVSIIAAVSAAKLL
ncbi:uncharacterized protein LOC124253361 isoform X2 [Haliotis rubra]|uniref:uncharacterized protein LOC124253361 isoform X2 n=1 Tax=Haliotis rubra TaxID=36100 RepID=UPI001EE5FDFF|nr:uncharacterized protein LOC124253361 isoform X2 [Haliotis rubra]